MNTNTLTKKKIIVTGASGFIGAHLVNYLLGKNLDVVGYYRNFSYRFNKLCITQNVINVKSYIEIPEGDDYVLIHLAQESNVENSNSSSASREQKSDELTKFLIKKKFFFYIYLSSSIIYGDKENSPINEEALNLLSNNYSKMKIRNENFFDVEKSALLRIANVYGNYMNKGNIFDDIISQLPCESYITLKNGDAVREFLYIDDLCEAIHLILINPIYGVFNLGSGTGVSINKLAKLIGNHFQNENLNVVSSNKYSRKSSLLLNSEKIIKKLKWKPTVDIKQGVKKLISLK